MSIHVSTEEWATWEAEREAANDTYADERHAREVRARVPLIAALQDEVEALETREWFARECLAAALELAEDLREQLTFEQDLLRAVLQEQHTPNVIDLPRAA